MATSKPRAERDEDLKAIALVNRKRAYDLLIQRYREKIFYHALYILKDPQEAKDVAQEVFIRSFKETKAFDPDFKVKAWLFRVCTNLCYNIVRDKKRRTGILDNLGRQDIHPAPLNAVDHTEKREMSARMAAAMDQLSLAHRTILLLKYWDDLSYLEISEVLDVKLGTVMSRLSRAKEKLSFVLERERWHAAEGLTV
ncbi:MAG: RNA polymerase sigma factor [Myxococcota bacterium]|nr:RNA polymerase sigma factor [Myxococcota bacterium]